MKTGKNGTGAARVSVAGKEYRLLKTDEVICAEAAGVLKGCMLLNIRDEAAVLGQLQRMADVLDGWLGAGAVRELSGGEPVGMALLLKTINGIVAARSAWYGEYIKGEYGGDGR